MENNEAWTVLSPAERENYLSFHATAYLDDLKHAEDVALKFPRWSIISGYYAMRDVTKLFLAVKFAIKISSPSIHEKTLDALREKVQDAQIKKMLLKLLDEAKDIYFNTERLKEKVLPELLKQGRQQRGQSQYYTEDYAEARQANSRKAVYFLDTFVKPYVGLIEGLLK